MSSCVCYYFAVSVDWYNDVGNLLWVLRDQRNGTNILTCIVIFLMGRWYEASQFSDPLMWRNGGKTAHFFLLGKKHRQKVNFHPQVQKTWLNWAEQSCFWDSHSECILKCDFLPFLHTDRRNIGLWVISDYFSIHAIWEFKVKDFDTFSINFTVGNLQLSVWKLRPPHEKAVRMNLMKLIACRQSENCALPSKRLFGWI